MTKTRPLNSPFHLLVLHDYRFAVELLAQRLKADPAMRMVSIGHHPATALSTAARQRGLDPFVWPLQRASCWDSLSRSR